jgi:hypothetical protein
VILRQAVLDGIRAGDITLAFRRWVRPTVKAGGTLLTAAGQLHIGTIRVVAATAITAADARRAGYPSRQALIDDLNTRDVGDIYRIELGALTADPRVALRARPAQTSSDLHALREALARLDARAADGPWTTRVLRLIARHPGRRAGDLCREMGQEMLPFKANVRKLKALGLTESLEVGYRLSPRGSALLDTLGSAALS